MAQLVFSSVGAAIGGRLLPAGLSVFGTQLGGALIGQAVGATVGASIDSQLFGQRVEGPRIRDIYVTESREGAPIPFALGRCRVGGQVIWAARFRERRESEGASKGGAGFTRYRYSLSFAVGICRGRVHGVSRIWANGRLFGLSGVNWRLYTGQEDQLPDPLIEAIEGSGQVPAFRGLSYIVFEDLPLDAFGARIPQFSFEVLCNPSSSGLESDLRQVNMIPGSGEFAYAVDIVRRRHGPGEELAENMNNYSGRSDLQLSLDQLAVELPGVDHVNLVVAWFGDDLRCDRCRIRPGVEVRDKRTVAMQWSVGGTNRGEAYLVSRGVDGRPAYGGTPSDESVVQAIRELRQRGYGVTLYPFILMDIAAGNGLEDPWGGLEQAVHPWRGRITLPKAPGRIGSTDGSAQAEQSVRDFFGLVRSGGYGTDSRGRVSYGFVPDWRYRHFILHHAALAVAGGADGILIGSEMPGLTRVRGRSGMASIMADKLVELAADVRSMVGSEMSISYAADWTEYGGYVPPGTDDLLYPLDSLWADGNIAYVGLDWYAPMADIRAGSEDSAYDVGYLRSNIEGGEGYDWYYASQADRLSGNRRAISSGFGDQVWAYRQKDVRNWWSNDHFQRVSGMSIQTAWRGGIKPVRFVEFGFPAINNGVNQPNVFYDPKSSESALPYNSDGTRDDLVQRRAIESFIGYWSESANNPVSSVYGGRMVMGAAAWAWDARPYPAFPTRSEVWGDGGSWRRGHWLNGRVGIPPLDVCVDSIFEEAGLPVPDVSGLTGVVSGYSFEGPVEVRRVLEPLQSRYGFDVVSRDGRLVFSEGGGNDPVVMDSSDLVIEDGGEGAPLSVSRERVDTRTGPLRIRFIDSESDYLVGMEAVDGDPGAPVRDVSLPLVMDRGQARVLAGRIRRESDARSLTCSFGLSSFWLHLEPGDLVELEGLRWRIRSISDRGYRQVEAVRAWRSGRILASPEPAIERVPPVRVTPDVEIVDAPALPGEEDDSRPLVFAHARPWKGSLGVYVGVEAGYGTERARIEYPSVMGRLLTSLGPGYSGRWMGYGFEVELSGGESISRTRQAVLSGANSALVETVSGWELLQFATGEMTGVSRYRLSDILRGQQGSEGAALSGASVGSRIVMLSGELVRIGGVIEREAELVWRVQESLMPSDVDWTGRHTHVPVSDRQWNPAHLRVSRGVGDWEISWVRRARIGGDAWTREEPPLEGDERYIVKIADSVDRRMIRQWRVAVPWVRYSLSQRRADGVGDGVDRVLVLVAQIGPEGREGHYSELLV